MAHGSMSFHTGERVASFASVFQEMQAQSSALPSQAGLMKTGNREELASGQKPCDAPASSAMAQPCLSLSGD